MLSSLAPARRRLVLGSLVALLVVVVVSVTLALVNRAPAARPLPQSDPGPVVLVPGYGGSTTSLDALARTLRAHGKDATVVTLPGDGRGDLAAQARDLGNAVGAVLKRTGAATVDVIGYSAGGVVVRLWVRNDGGDRLARRVITLGSPQHGTGIAAAAGGLVPGACPTACEQLATDSSLLADLNAGDETPTGPTFVSIWTTHDDVVLPPDSASLDGALDLTVQSVCASDTVEHGGLPEDPNVQAIVLAELAAGAPRTPTGIDCVSS